MGVLMDNVRQGFNLLFTPVLYYGVVASIAIQLSTWERGDRTQDKLQNQYANNGDNFDFIIVGGGTAGLVLANRLSQYYSILVLEAGGEPAPLQFVPGLARSIVGHSQVDWLHKTVAQKKSSAFSQFRRASWPSGKTLGGSGSLDFLMYQRGNPEDMDNWARITKDISWKYDNLLPHFQRAEDIVANSTDPGAHRHGGELRIQKSEYLPLGKQFLAAANELGYPTVDLNGHFTEGFDLIYSTIKKGERQAPVKAFLDPIRKRKTLTIRKFAFVTKIKFRNDNTAYGVEYERHGDKFTVFANREIIVSAGAIGSPKILMLSGIGPKRHLEEFGVKNIVNAPVGQNLQDHVGTYLGPFFINEPLSFEKERDITAESYVDYGTQGSGPLTTAGFSATGFVSSSYAKGRGESAWPDLQLTLYPTSVDKSFATDIAHTHGLQAETLKKYYNHAIGKHSFHILTSVSRPAGRGEIKLASRTPADPLVINPKYLEDQWNLDIKAMIDGLKKALRIVEGSTVFQNIGGHFTSEVLPGCESTKFRSDEYFECYVRHYTVSMFNPVGTCAMGPADSLFAVVDPKLRVIGTKGLRVVDASVMPSIVVGGTQAATIAIAEKAAQMILNHWSHHHPNPNPVVDVTTVTSTHVSSSNSIETSISAPQNGAKKTNGLVIPPQMPPLTQKVNPIPMASKLESFLKSFAPAPPKPTSKPETVVKSMSPFSVNIKTSSPTPFTAFSFSTKPLVTTTTRPITTTTQQTTTTTALPVTTQKPKPNTTGVPHVSFPIINTKNKSGGKYTSTKTPAGSKYATLPKLHYFGVGGKVQSSTVKPRQNGKYRSTTTTQRPKKIPTRWEILSDTTTSNPFEFASSGYSIQSAENNDEDLVPTTYRPDIMLLDTSAETAAKNKQQQNEHKNSQQYLKQLYEQQVKEEHNKQYQYQTQQPAQSQHFEYQPQQNNQQQQYGYQQNQNQYSYPQQQQQVVHSEMKGSPEDISFGKSILYLVQKNQNRQTQNSQHTVTRRPEMPLEITEISQPEVHLIQPESQEYMNLPEVPTQTEYRTIPGMSSHLIPPAPVSPSPRTHYSKGYNTQTALENYPPVPQFDIHDFDEGYVNDRYARFDRQQRFQQEQIKLHQQNKHPIRVVQRHPHKTNQLQVPNIRTQQPQIVRHYRPKAPTAQPTTHAQKNAFQPAAVLYHGSADSINNYQMSPVHSAQQSFPSVTYLRRYWSQ